MSSAWLEMLGYGAECCWFCPSFYQPNSKRVPVLCQVLGWRCLVMVQNVANSKQVPVLCQVLGWRCLVMVQNVAGSIHLSINLTVNKYLYYVKCLVGDAWLWCRMWLVLSIFLSTQQ